MSAKAIAFSKSILDANLKNGTPYLALMTTAGGAPTGAAAGTELTGNAYARVALVFGAATGTTTASATTTAKATFPTPTPAGWSEASYWAIYDAVSGGNRLYYGTLSTPRTAAVNVPEIVSAGALIITES